MRDKRRRCSALLEIENNKILIDCGPDFRQQALDINLQKIDAILLTHKHVDHIGGIDDSRPYGEVKLYLDKDTESTVRQMYGYCFAASRYPGTPILELNTIDEKSFKICNDSIDVIPIRVMHGQAEIKGYRIGKFAYITDVTALADEAEYDKLKGLDILVLGCLRKKEHHSHQTYDEAVAMARKIGAAHTYFTHMCHEIGKHADIEKMTPDGITFAYDGLVVDF